MATYDLSKGSNGGIAGFQSGFTFRLIKEIDFSLTNYASGDVLTLFQVPAGTKVADVAYEIVNAETNTLTFGLGDPGSATQYVTAASANTKGARGCSSSGKFYATASTITLTLGAAAVLGKVRVYAQFVPFFTT